MTHHTQYKICFWYNSKIFGVNMLYLYHFQFFKFIYWLTKGCSWTLIMFLSCWNKQIPIVSRNKIQRRPTNQLNPPSFLGSVHLDEVDESEGWMKHAGIAVAAGATGWERGEQVGWHPSKLPTRQADERGGHRPSTEEGRKPWPAPPSPYHRVLLSDPFPSLSIQVSPSLSWIISLPCLPITSQISQSSFWFSFEPNLASLGSWIALQGVSTDHCMDSI